MTAMRHPGRGGTVAPLALSRVEHCPCATALERCRLEPSSKPPQNWRSDPPPNLPAIASGRPTITNPAMLHLTLPSHRASAAPTTPPNAQPARPPAAAPIRAKPCSPAAPAAGTRPPVLHHQAPTGRQPVAQGVSPGNSPRTLHQQAPPGRHYLAIARIHHPATRPANHQQPRPNSLTPPHSRAIYQVLTQCRNALANPSAPRLTARDKLTVP
jgi:hypothetical protein